MSLKSTDGVSSDVGVHQRNNVRLKYVGQDFLLQVKDPLNDHWNQLPVLITMEHLRDLLDILLVETR